MVFFVCVDPNAAKKYAFEHCCVQSWLHLYALIISRCFSRVTFHWQIPKYPGNLHKNGAKRDVKNKAIPKNVEFNSKATNSDVYNFRRITFDLILDEIQSFFSRACAWKNRVLFHFMNKNVKKKETITSSTRWEKKAALFGELSQWSILGVFPLSPATSFDRTKTQTLHQKKTQKKND